MTKYIFEIIMLVCFACSWPVSIVKALKTKIVIGKSPFFMIIIIIGYIFGIIHKLVNEPGNWVVWLYALNLVIVSCDLFLYFKYIEQNRRDLQQKQR
jgi:hypothetical protein